MFDSGDEAAAAFSLALREHLRTACRRFAVKWNRSKSVKGEGMCSSRRSTSSSGRPMRSLPSIRLHSYSIRIDESGAMPLSQFRNSPLANGGPKFEYVRREHAHIFIAI